VIGKVIVTQITASDKNKTLFGRIQKEISSRSYAQLPFPLSYDQLSHAADLFINGFLKLPQEEKEKIAGFVDEQNRKGELGYRKVDRSEKNRDTKEFFHYNDRLRDRFAGTIHKGPKELKDFIKAADEIFQTVKTTIRPVFESFEPYVPGITDSFLPKYDYANFFLRFLAYRPVDTDHVLAVPHIDKGYFTQALAESTLGLRIGKDGESLTPVYHNEGSSLFFMGKDISKILPEDLRDDFPPGLHDVVQYSNPTSSEVPRWAIVCFMDPSHLLMGEDEDGCHPLGVDPKIKKGDRYELSSSIN